MRDMTDETTEKAAETLSKIQSYFWTPSMDKAPENEVEQRFVEYWKRVLRRASSVADDPILRKAYQMFLDRQLTFPLFPAMQVSRIQLTRFFFMKI